METSPDAGPDARFTDAAVRRYYDRHTPTFLAVGQSGSGGTIHRAVWGPGVRTRAEAFHFVEERLAALLLPRVVPGHTLRVADLGCGVGASLCYLASRLPITGVGLTLSPVQVRLAERTIEDASLGGRVTCVEADYCEPPDMVGTVDLAYAIESFVHGPSPARFFEAWHPRLRPGGLLVICDDFRRPGGGRAADRTVEAFSRGWHVNSLIDRETLNRVAVGAGFSQVETTDLTPWLELRRPRDRAAALLLGLLRRLRVSTERVDYLAGGSALQTGLALGWIGYDFAVYRRQA